MSISLTCAFGFFRWTFCSSVYWI